MHKLILPEEAAKLLSVSEGTLNRWRSTDKKDLPYIKVGGAIRYSVDDIERWVEKQRVK